MLSGELTVRAQMQFRQPIKAQSIRMYINFELWTTHRNTGK